MGLTDGSSGRWLLSGRPPPPDSLTPERAPHRSPPRFPAALLPFGFPSVLGRTGEEILCNKDRNAW